MRDLVRISLGAALWMSAMAIAARPGACEEAVEAAVEAALPASMRAVWDLGRAYRAATPTREAVSINGLWRWQPAEAGAERVPEGGWGWFKVPGCWPGITDYLQKDCQTVHPHAAWKDARLGSVGAAWYQRRIEVPAGWTGRRIVLRLECLNSWAAAFVDGRRAGEARFPGGEVDLTAACRPGEQHALSLLVVAMPLRAVMLSFRDTASAREMRGSVERRGLCGDAWLVGEPSGARLREVKVDTSVRKGEIAFRAGIDALPPGARHVLRARIEADGRQEAELASDPFTAADLEEGRFAFTAPWKPDRLWDLHTPGNQYRLTLSLLGADGRLVDEALPERFGFRELWIDGRDFRLNGSRLFLSAVPLDNAQVSAALASYEGARESLLRLKAIGINFVYTHNYGCEPGTHLGFAEILRAADDVGMLVALSQPHFAQYDWKAPDADRTNGYAGHAEHYVRVAGNHPSVVLYAMSHNATGYGEDMDPDQIDGIAEPRQSWGANNARLARRAEAIVERLDPARIVYHHSSGNLGSMHTVNFYTNFAPIQELDDWFEHWATVGVKPMFTCEYMVPCTWDWTMYRGWYQGGREFGSAVVPWDFCQAEWSAQFLGDRAYRIRDEEKANLRWEARQFREGRLWHRWDYPAQVGSKVFEDQHEVIARYLRSNWRAFRTWGVSAISPWEHHFFWTLRPGVDRRRVDLPVDWDGLQRPGFSPDYLDERYERMDLAYGRGDWLPTADGEAILLCNAPLLAWVAGKPGALTSNDHNFVVGETVEKQLIVINNSRETVVCNCEWPSSLSAGVPPDWEETRVSLPTGEQVRIPLRIAIPDDLAPGSYDVSAYVEAEGREPVDTGLVPVRGGPADPLDHAGCRIDVLPTPWGVPAPPPGERIALFDPAGETRDLLAALKVPFDPVGADADLGAYDLLVVGKAALSAGGPGPDLTRVRGGLKAIVFEQTSEALERRLGFRVAEYGLREVFRRVPDHPILAGLDPDWLRDWRGAATLLPPRLDYELSPRYAYTPTVRWCGLEVPRVWRCGNRGNVASVLIEKPPRGDFLPILDGGWGLQYSPLLEYREGEGLVVFCQLDVTGRTEGDPAADALVRNLLRYAYAWTPSPRRGVLCLGDPACERHLARAGVALETPEEGAPLPVEQVLVVAPGGGRDLAPRRAEVAAFLERGGRVLALGLGGEEASAFLPFAVETKPAEHIAASFGPHGTGSPVAGVCPADVHNRDPKDLPLVTGGAAPVGNGVLATAASGGGIVAFCQLLPWEVSRAEGALPSFAVGEADAADGTRSALLTMGCVTGAGVQLGQKVEAGAVGTTWTLSARVRAEGGPVRARLEIERPARPWDRAVKGPDVEVPSGPWMELAVTFRVETPFPEGWFAYLQCAQEGARLRVDAFRLHEGGRDAGDARNLLVNPSFEAGADPWRFSFHEQLNLRKTYRRASFLVTRLLANLGASGATPLLGRFGLPVKPEGESRWLDGLYLDEPEEWDDPYRFFRW